MTYRNISNPRNDICCYLYQDITKTVCTEVIDPVDNEICLIVYEPKVIKTSKTTLEVTFGKKCLRQMLTVCQPAKIGYGHKPDFSHNYCKEIAQDTCFNFPIVTIKEVDAEVTVPEPVERCSNVPILLPRIVCEDVITEQCVVLPDVEESSESLEECTIQVA